MCSLVLHGIPTAVYYVVIYYSSSRSLINRDCNSSYLVRAWDIVFGSDQQKWVSLCSVYWLKYTVLLFVNLIVIDQSVCTHAEVTAFGHATALWPNGCEIDIDLLVCPIVGIIHSARKSKIQKTGEEKVSKGKEAWCIYFIGVRIW